MVDTAQNPARFQPSGFQGAGRDDAEVDVRALFLMLWRRKMIILGCLLVGLSLSTLAMTFMKSRYTGRALVLIENNGPQKGIEELQAFMTSFRIDPSFILGEIEVLKSRTMGRKIVERLNMMADPEFNPRFRSALKTNKNEKTPKNFKTLSLYGSELDKFPEDVIDKEVSDVVTNFLVNLNVRSVPGSMAIQIEYTATDPNKAALIANTIVDLYLEQRLENKFQATQKVTKWLDQRLHDLRKQVQSAESAVAQYKAQYNLTEGVRNVAVSAEQLSALNSELVIAKSKQAEAEARLKELDDMSNNTGQMETTTEIVNSGLIQTLKNKQAELESRLSELSLRYGYKHPDIQKVKSELGELKTQIHDEVLKIAKSVENEVTFAKARVKALEEGLSEYAGQQHEDNTVTIELRELERQAQATRLVYDTFLNTYKKSDDQEKLQSPEARVISYAVPPRTPTYPNKMLLLSLSGAISLFLGLALALLIEKMDNTFRSAGQLETLLGYPCYALIPKLENMSQTELTQYILSKPSSVVAEAVRTLRMVLNLRAPNPDMKPRCVTITSSFPGEGKTTLSVWLGRLAAKSGEKVIIIDADLRRPNVHRAIGETQNATLVEYLTGQKDLSEVIQTTDVSGVHIIYGRSVPNSALDLVSSEKMHRLVASLKQVYDLVILDTPACLAVSDARILAKMSDQLIYVVSWDKTPREVVMSGVKQFTDMQFNALAFTLTNVDVKRHVRYGYGDTAYYYGRYKEYYTE